MRVGEGCPEECGGHMMRFGQGTWGYTNGWHSANVKRLGESVKVGRSSRPYTARELKGNTSFFSFYGPLP